ncbi:hypothetical protein R1flu_013334 [Riccia fluitans]|uniref:Uncharacterized protein n=1 Tax=Riccia fluitans TaxID=41844 RepID=A0ABD1YD32_9MARC
MQAKGEVRARRRSTTDVGSAAMGSVRDRKSSKRHKSSRDATSDWPPSDPLAETSCYDLESEAVRLNDLVKQVNDSNYWILASIERSRLSSGCIRDQLLFLATQVL